MATPAVAEKLAALEAALTAAAAASAAKDARIAELEGEVLDPNEIAALDRLVQMAATLAPTPPPAPDQAH